MSQQQQGGGRFPKPTGPTLWLMLGLLCIWVTFAAALNWGGMDSGVFNALAGDSNLVLNGELWRLLTAALLHTPDGPGAVMHILVSLLILYFFVPPLQAKWGTKKLFVFLFGSAMFAFGIETILHQLLPSVARGQWYGGMVMGDAAVVAWAVGARGQTVRFYFVIPMRPMVMIGIMVAWHVLQVIANAPSQEGMFAPFAAMGAGWLFTEASPLRRVFLKWKLRRLQGEVDDITTKRKKRVKASHLHVIPGGGGDDDDGPILH
jgi:membrane associated rhomboid family serine protease